MCREYPNDVPRANAKLMRVAGWCTPLHVLLILLVISVAGLFVRRDVLSHKYYVEFVGLKAWT